MPVFLNDTFTEASDKSLASHAPEIGGAWVVEATALTVIAASGWAKSDTAGVFATAYNNVTPPSADYEITATLRVTSTTSGANWIVWGRYITASGGSGYYLRYTVPTGFFTLVRRTAGVDVELGRWNATMPSDTDWEFRIVLAGNRITVYTNGEQKLDVTDSAPVTGAGRIRFSLFTDARISAIQAATAGDESSRPQVFVCT